MVVVRGERGEEGKVEEGREECLATRRALERMGMGRDGAVLSFIYFIYTQFSKASQNCINRNTLSKRKTKIKN